MQNTGLKAKLNDDMRQAMRSGDTVKRDTIRFLLADVKNAEIAKMQTLDDAGIVSVIAKEVKQREESILAFKAGNRQDLVDKESAEMAIIKTYMPPQAGREEIVTVTKRIIEETGAKGPGDKGKVIPKVIAEFKGKASGQEINAVVTELLASKS